MFSSCSRVKNHFDEDPRHAAIALRRSPRHRENGCDVVLHRKILLLRDHKCMCHYSDSLLYCLLSILVRFYITQLHKHKTEGPLYRQRRQCSCAVACGMVVPLNAHQLCTCQSLANDSDRLFRNRLHVLKEVGYSQCYLLYLPLKCKNHLCHGFLSSFGKTANINL